MRLRGITAVSGLLLLLTGLGSSVGAQDAPDEQAPQPDEATQPEQQTKKLPFALYVEVAGGSADADEINNSVRTFSTHNTQSSFSLDGQSYGRAAIGWKMPHGKGSYRLIWTGYKEQDYELTASGLQASLDPSLASSASVQDNLPWWQVSLKNGAFEGTRMLPQWSTADDTLEYDGFDDRGQQRNILSGNGAVDCPIRFPLMEDSNGVLTSPVCEASYLVDRVNTRVMADDMQNRAQTVDLVYGRVFGPRRYTSHWFAGLRYFVYDGNVPTSAWISPGSTGGGFTEGSAYALLNFAQETSGFGPTVSMSIDFNFFDQKLALYLQGQAALMLYNLKTDSQGFFTLVESALPSLITLPAELVESRDKTSWQNSIELGARINLKSGLQFEIAWNFSGFLDAILLPSEIAIPINQQSTQGVSAIYDTQDYRLEAWRAGIAFQF
jgi:hypothetical protein